MVGMDAIGMVDQFRLDRLARAHRTACSGTGPCSPTGGECVLAGRQLSGIRSGSPDDGPSRIKPRPNRLRVPSAHTPTLRACSVSIYHSPARGAQSRCRQPQSLTRSLAGHHSPLCIQLTPNALFHLALSRSHGWTARTVSCCLRLG